MKKIFSFFAALLVAGSIMADQVTFTKADFSKVDDDAKAQKDGVSISCKGNVPKNGDYVTFTEGNVLTITSTEGNITAIDFTSSEDAYVGNLTDVSGINTDTWTTTVDNPGNKTTVRVVSIVVTYTSNAAVAKPTFSVMGGTYDATQSVELSCATDGATIYYNIDSDEDPTEASTQYTTAIAIPEGQHVVKAIAVKGEDKSKVATATYIVVLPFASLQLLAAADYLPDPTNVTVTLDDEVIKSFYEYPAGTRSGVVFDVQRDGKDIKIFFQSTETIVGWKVGGKLSGTLTNAKWTTYNSEWQLKPAEGFKWADLEYEEPSATAIEDTFVNDKAVKSMKNGQLIIIKNGVRYNALGTAIR